MGRVKVELKKIENKSYRQITFAKRKNGLIKKAYELSTLCDVEVALIVFSPAGKLFLFDGKRRMEEILTHYIDLPARRRGWVQNQESIRRIITDMSLEGGFHNQPTNIHRTNKVDIDSQLQKIQKEIIIYSTQLEDVEKQLQYFLRNPSLDRSMSEIGYHELMLEETLKLVLFRKQILEANGSVQFQPTPQESGDHAIRCHSGERNLHAPRAFTRSNGLHLSRNIPEPLVEHLPSSMSTYPQAGHRYFTTSNEVNGETKLDVYTHHSVSRMVINANFHPTMDNMIIQQARATSSAAHQCEARSSMRTFCGNVSNYLDSNVWFRH